MNHVGSYENQVLDWACFTGLMLVCYDQTLRNSELVSWLSRYNFFATLYILILGATQALGFDLLPNLGKNEFPVSFFGFQNMTAEFVGVSLLIQLYVFRQGHSKGRYLTLWHIFLMTLTGIYLASLHCRTVFVALILGLAPVFYRNLNISYLKRHFLAAVATSAILVGFIAFEGTALRSISRWSGMHGSSTSLDQAKEGNIQIRKIRWMNTLQMIEDHPLGIGPGRFSLIYPTYHAAYQRDPESTEQMVVRSPHNDYLRLTAEIGLQGLVWLLVTLAALFCRKQRNGGMPAPDSPVADLSLGVLLFTTGLALFAFPFENAYPFYATAVFLGIYLSIKTPNSKPLPYLTVGFGFAACIVGVLGFGYAASRYIEVIRADDLEVNAFACRWFPSNWWTCVQAGHLALEKGDSHRAEKIAIRLLSESPDNSYGTNLLVLALKAQGRVDEGCKLAERHERLFGARNTAGIDDVCSAKNPHGS
jgi:O-antigen ligase